MIFTHVLVAFDAVMLNTSEYDFGVLLLLRKWLHFTFNYLHDDNVMCKLKVEITRPDEISITFKTLSL